MPFFRSGRRIIAQVQELADDPPRYTTDLPDVLAFWNPMIRDTTVTFSSEEKTLASLSAMIAARRAAGQEFFVAEDAGRVLGFVTYGQFRSGNGYVHAMEHTIILAPEARGMGLGRTLMATLEDHARAGELPYHGGGRFCRECGGRGLSCGGRATPKLGGCGRRGANSTAGSTLC